MEKLKELQLKEFLDIYINAYPAIEMNEEQKTKSLQNLINAQHDQGNVKTYGCIRDGKLLGGMKVYDFIMNYHGKKMPVGGVGSVAVHLLHKKERVCKELITDFLNYCNSNGQKIASLYAFRPSFYRQMGFGYGTKNSKYRVSAMGISAMGDRKKVVYLSSQDKERIAMCYETYLNNVHGMMQKSPRELDGIFLNERNKVVGYLEDGQLKGYMVFEFVKGDNFLTNHIAVTELIHNIPDALQGFCSFLRAQADQIQDVIFYSQDVDFYHLFEDPRNTQGSIFPHVTHETNKDGIGTMYRIVDCDGFIKEMESINIHCLALVAKINVTDTFLPANNKSYVIEFKEGIRLSKKEWKVEINIDISDLSSLFMGAVSFDSLYSYGRVTLSNSEYVKKLNFIFGQFDKPKCITKF